MKKKFFLAILVIASASILLISCTKGDEPTADDSSSSSPKTTEELLTGSWQIVSYSYTLRDPERGRDVAEELGECAKDNETIFSADKKYFDNEGTVKCEEIDDKDQTDDEDKMDDKDLSGTWALLQNNTRVVVTLNEVPVILESEIVTLTDTSLTLKTFFSNKDFVQNFKRK